MTPDVIVQILNNQNGIFLFSAKIFFILGSIIYFIFALIVVKQISNISKHIHTKINPILKVFSYIHLTFSLFLIFLTFIIL